MFLLLTLLSYVCVSFAIDNGLGDLPPMGWNSWNLAGCHINETFFRATVDALAQKGFAKAGYTYINLDDCWMDTKRDANGDLQWGPNFPTGSTLGDYIHSKGFKFGMYLSAGPKTCSLRDPNNRSATGWGSYGNEGRDAMWIAKQGADYLKYDAVCGGDYNAPPLNTSFDVMNWERVVVTKMGTALNATGRPIWYQYGSPYTWNRHGAGYGNVQWITNNASGGGVNSFRSGFDMADNFGNVGEEINGVVTFNRNIHNNCDGTCPWADADCLEIGNNLTKINIVQSQTYFSWYAIANAPLIMSTRIDTLDPRIISIFQNPEVIQVNQDYAGSKGQPVMSPLSKSGYVWAKPLSSEATAAKLGYASQGAAALVFSRGCASPTNCQSNATVFFADLGFDATTTASVYDIVQHKDLGDFVGSYTAEFTQADESALVKITPKQV
eukprot:m.77804 g.77804  ORF g.77804 m.77804 type:complete len:439 (+) comp25055_c0_seq1:96-1412(+)